TGVQTCALPISRGTMATRIYLDHASTTPVAAEVLEAMLPYLGARFGNASSLHARGQAARDAVDQARAAVAGLVRALPGELLFTASATESNRSEERRVGEGGRW